MCQPADSMPPLADMFIVGSGMSWWTPRKSQAGHVNVHILESQVYAHVRD